jgi:hypothetical protein
MTDYTLPALVGAMAAGAVTVLAVIIFFVVFVHPIVPTEPSTRSVELGHLRYEAVDGRVLDPAQREDARLVAGLPRRTLRPRSGQLLFAVFIGVTNDTPAPKPLATRIELRDQLGHRFAPIRLPAANPFAYDRREIGGRSRFPAAGTDAASDLAAGGSLLLYRIPARTYANSVLEIEIHDPLNARAAAYLTV